MTCERRGITSLPSAKETFPITPEMKIIIVIKYLELMSQKNLDSSA